MGRIIEIENLKKSYGEVKAVDDISFYVQQGSLFAFLGPNGAGKSTTISILNTYLKPDSGSVNIAGLTLGRDDSEIRSQIGVVFQEGVLDQRLTVWDNLMIRGSLYKLRGRALKKAAEAAAEIVGATEFLNRPYGKLSGGQRRRADIARALLNTPKILFLDEPSTGLDPQTRLSIWETVKKLQSEQGITVFLTTHYLEEAESAGYVVIIDKGKIAAKGTPVDLKRRFVKDELYLYPQKGAEKVLYDKLDNTVGLTVKNEVAVIPLDSTFEALSFIDEYKSHISDFEVRKGTMDGLFVAVTGREMR